MPVIFGDGHWRYDLFPQLIKEKTPWIDLKRLAYLM